MASKKRQTVFSDGQSTSENLPSSNSLLKIDEKKNSEKSFVFRTISEC